MRALLFLILFYITLFSNDNIVLQLRGKSSFRFAGFYMAKEKGFYKDRDLNVTFKVPKNSQNLIESVLNDDAQYGISGSSLIYYKLKNYPIVALMPIFSKSLLSILSNSRNVRQLKDLQNKTAFIDISNKDNISIITLLHLCGIDAKKIRYKNSQNDIDDIIHKSDAIFSVSVDEQPFYLKERDVYFKLFKPSDYGLNFYGDMLFTSEKELAYHSQRTQRFLEASIKGWKYALSHIDETINTIMQKYNDDSNLTYKFLKYQVKLYGEYISKDFSFQKNKILEIKRLYKVLKKIHNDFDYDDFVYNPHLITKEEKEFVKDHKFICVSTYSWAPFNLLIDGKLSGISVDYWKIVKKRLNLKTSCILKKSFSEVLNSIKNKKADITLSTTITKDREKYAVFSKPYVTFPIVITTRNSVGFISSIKSIKDKVFAAPLGYTTTKILKENYPNIKLVMTKDIDQALSYVSQKKAYAVLGILPVVAYKINNFPSNNLKIAGTTKYDFPVRFMVRKDYAELIPSINRVIDTIDKKEKELIYRKWIMVNMQNGYPKEKVFRIYIVAIIIILILLLWMTTLSIQISKRKKIEKKLEKLAIYDKLTSIFNRYKIDISMEEQLEIAKRYGKKLSFIFFDIDFFKKVNDTFGHKAGDTVLKEIVDIVKRKIRKSDIFGRWGGEEFVVILPENDIKHANMFAELLRKEIENHHFLKVGNITCSFGVTNIAQNDTIDDIMKRLDEALYRAKNSGRNRVDTIPG